MEESFLKTPEPVELTAKSENAETKSSTSDIPLTDVLKLECDKMVIQSYHQKLENLLKPIGLDVEYELFHTVIIDHVPNYCYKTTALGLFAIGKGWSVEEAKEKCAQALLNKYANIKSNSEKALKTPKPIKEKDVEFDMKAPTLNDAVSKVNIISTSHGKRHGKTSTAVNNLKSKTFYSTNGQSKINKNEAVIASEESADSSGLAMSIAANDEQPEKPEMDHQNVKTNSNIKSDTPIKQKITSIPVKPASSKIDFDSNTHVISTENIRPKMETKNRNGLFCSNPVQKLQQISMTSNIQSPIYIKCQPSGSLNDLTYIVKCSFIGHNVYGEGPNKRRAKAKAAENMLRMMISFGWRINLD